MSTAATPENPLADLRRRRQAVLRRLAVLRGQIRGHLFVEGLAWTLGAMLLGAAATLFVDWMWRVSLPMRWTLLAAAIAGIAAVAYRHWFAPLAVRLDDLDLAQLLDRRVAGFGQRVANVLQLPELIEGTPQASPTLVRATVSAHAAELEQVDIGSLLDAARRKRMAILAVGCVVAAGAFAVCMPNASRIWAQRFFLGSDVRWPQRTYLSIVGLGDGNRLRVPRGESLLLEIDAAPRFERTAEGWSLPGRGAALLVSGDGEPSSALPDQVHVVYASTEGEERQGNAALIQGATFRYELPPVREPLELHVTGGDDWLGPIMIEPIDRPTVREMTIHAVHPGYRLDETTNLADLEGQLLFLSDTQLELRIEASAPLASAALKSDTGEAPPVEQLDGTHLRVKWNMREAVTWQLQLVAEDGGLASRPYYLSFGLLQDRAPRVTARSTGVGRRITPQARIPLALRALDDFGITAMSVELEKAAPEGTAGSSGTEHVVVEMPEGYKVDEPAKELERDPTVRLAGFALTPGMLLKLRGTAIDNCAAAAQTGQSRVLTYQVVTPEELFYEILMRQREQRARFSTALDSAKKQEEVLAALDAEKLPGVQRAHQVIARQVAQVTTQLDATLHETILNELGSEQARELLQSGIIEPLRALQSTQLAELRESLDQLGATAELDAVTITQAQERERAAIVEMERILQQMSQWESFVDVLNQVRQIIKLESDVLDAAKQLREKETQGVFEEE